nr:alpha/beta fold hydrolase [uncultured Hyphomonas sp.]
MKHASFFAALTGAALLAACTTAPDETPLAAPMAPEVEAEAETAAPAYDEAFPPAIEEISFDSHGDRLNGLVYVAEGEGPHPAVVLLHGFPGNEKNLDLAQDMRAAGWNVLFFHYRGAWGSEGDYTLTHVIEDVASAADFLRTHADQYRTNPDHIVLVGHSMGGFASLQAAARDDAIRCAAGIAPANVGAMAEFFEADPQAKAGFMAYSDSLQMLHGLTGEKIMAEIEANKDSFALQGLAPDLEGKRILIVGGDKDTSVPADAIILPLIAAYEADPAIDTTGVVLSGDHSFSWSRDELISTVIDWAEACR